MLSLPGPRSCLREYAEPIFCMRTDKLQSRIPSPHTTAQAPKKPYFAGKRRSRRGVGSRPAAGAALPRHRASPAEPPAGVATRGLGAGPRRGRPRGAPQGGGGGAAPRSASGPERWPRSRVLLLRHRGATGGGIPAPSRPLPAQSFTPSVSDLLPPLTWTPRRGASPPPPPAAGTAGPELCRGSARRAGAAGADPALAAGAPGQGGRGGAAREPRQPRLPLSSVSGWTAVSVAISAAGLEPEWRATPAPAWSAGKGGEEAGRERGRRRRVAPWEEEASGAEKVPKGGRLIAHGPPRCCGRRAARRGPARAAGMAALRELGLPSGPRFAALASGKDRAPRRPQQPGPCAEGGSLPVPPPRGCRSCRRRKREGRGRELRSAAGRGGPAGSGGPASPGPGAVGRAGPGGGTESGVPGEARLPSLPAGKENPRAEPGEAVPAIVQGLGLRDISGSHPFGWTRASASSVQPSSLFYLVSAAGHPSETQHTHQLSTARGWSHTRGGRLSQVSYSSCEHGGLCQKPSTKVEFHWSSARFIGSLLVFLPCHPQKEKGTWSVAIRERCDRVADFHWVAAAFSLVDDGVEK